MGCRTRRPADELVRVWRSTDGTLRIGKGPGRGAWLCRGSEACREAAIGRRAFDRAFRAPVARSAAEGLRDVKAPGGREDPRP